MVAEPRVGVLALQGDVQEHAEGIIAGGGRSVDVRRPADLGGIDALVIPGGESTVLQRLIDLAGLREPLLDLIGSGLPVLGTCAGLIVLATDIEDGAAGQRPLGLLSCVVRRNAYGGQLQSFGQDVTVRLGREVVVQRSLFIRAPQIRHLGQGVDVLAHLEDGAIVGVKQGNIVGLTFHPELSNGNGLHGWFVRGVRTGVLTG